MAKREEKRNSGSKKFTQKMSIKLAVLFVIILVAFAFLSIRLFIINRDNGDKYKKRVLSQQAYDSVTPRLGVQVEKTEFQETHAPQHSVQHCLQHPRNGSHQRPSLDEQEMTWPGYTMDYYSAIRKGRW